MALFESALFGKRDTFASVCKCVERFSVYGCFEIVYGLLGVAVLESAFSFSAECNGSPVPVSVLDESVRPAVDS